MTREWESCLAQNPEDPEMECLSRKGHVGDHGCQLWPQGFHNGPAYEVAWNDERVTYDERAGETTP